MAPAPTAASSPVSYTVESNNEVRMTRREISEMIRRAGFDAVERDAVYNRVEKALA